ncbi:MAG: PAS domain S-box protein, partial [Promethearchaeota archaeon]
WMFKMAKVKEIKKKYDDSLTPYSINSTTDTDDNSLENDVIKSSEWLDAIDWAKKLIRDFNEKNEVKLVETKTKESKNKYELISENRNEFDEKKFKDALYELVNSQIKYRLICENAEVLICILNKYFKFDFINKIFNQKVLGYGNDELIGEYFDRFIHAADIKPAIKLVEEVWKKKEAKGEIRFKRKDGRYIWIELNGKIFFDLDGEEKILLIGKDITEYKVKTSKNEQPKEKLWKFFHS